MLVDKYQCVKVSDYIILSSGLVLRYGIHGRHRSQCIICPFVADEIVVNFDDDLSEISLKATIASLIRVDVV